MGTIHYFYILVNSQKEKKDHVVSQTPVTDKTLPPILEVVFFQIASQTEMCESMSVADNDRDLMLVRLHRDLLVYVLADKYKVMDLTAKLLAAFANKLQKLEMEMDIFDLVRDVYSMILPQDRGLRNILVTKVHSELQH